MIEIILIGGASGCGKSSLSKKIANHFDFHHTLGSGFVRQIVREFISSRENKYLHTYSFDKTLDIKGYELLINQSLPLIEPIKSCIKRARNEGTKLIIEGVNIIPELYKDVDADLKVILKNEDEIKHFEMINGKSHSRREVTNNSFEMSRKIQKEFVNDALANNWIILNTKGAFDKISKIICTQK